MKPLIAYPQKIFNVVSPINTYFVTSLCISPIFKCVSVIGKKEQNAVPKPKSASHKTHG